MSYVDRSESKQYSFGTIGGLLGGYGISRLVGAAGWIPAIVGFGSFFLLKKLVDRNVGVIAALASIIAQTAWFLIAVLIAPEEMSAVSVDIAFNVALLAIVYIWPGYVSAGIVIAWAAFGILANIAAMTGQPLEVQRALAAHLILRAVIIASAVAIMIFKANPDLLPDPAEAEE